MLVDIVKWVTLVKFPVNCEGGDCTRCFKIEVGTDTVNFTNTRIARFVES